MELTRAIDPQDQTLAHAAHEERIAGGIVGQAFGKESGGGQLEGDRARRLWFPVALDGGEGVAAGGLLAAGAQLLAIVGAEREPHLRDDPQPFRGVFDPAGRGVGGGQLEHDAAVMRPERVGLEQCLQRGLAPTGLARFLGRLHIDAGIAHHRIVFREGGAQRDPHHLTPAQGPSFRGTQPDRRATRGSVHDGEVRREPAARKRRVESARLAVAVPGHVARAGRRAAIFFRLAVFPQRFCGTRVREGCTLDVERPFRAREEPGRARA